MTFDYRKMLQVCDDVPLINLPDNFAIAAMTQLMHIYSTEEIGEREEMVQWCEAIASTSYVMAAAMMNARSILHKAMVSDSPDKGEYAA
jgi:hypothetical protein